MPPSNSRLAMADCFEVFDKALEAPKGIRVRFPDIGAAKNYQMKLMRARAQNREDNLGIYPQGHPLHGRSPYDRLQVSFDYDNGDALLVIRALDVSMTIEEIE